MIQEIYRSLKESRDLFIAQTQLRMAAVCRLDPAAANRHLAKAKAAAETLAATPEGRAEIEKLLAHPVVHIRLSAAEEMADWAPETAIPIFGRLLDADLIAMGVGSPDERLDIRDRAKSWLYRYFDVRSWNRNDLIEPLKAYGVELTYRDHSKWQQA